MVSIVTNPVTVWNIAHLKLANVLIMFEFLYTPRGLILKNMEGVWIWPEGQSDEQITVQRQTEEPVWILVGGGTVGLRVILIFSKHFLRDNRACQFKRSLLTFKNKVTNQAGVFPRNLFAFCLNQHLPTYLFQNLLNRDIGSLH